MLFDTKWNAIPKAVNHPSAQPVLRPKSLDTMLQIAAQLSKGIDFVRIDFYEIGDKPIFGEITLTPDILTYIRPSFSPLMQLHLQ